jgi:hypothetical protein
MDLSLRALRFIVAVCSFFAFNVFVLNALMNAPQPLEARRQQRLARQGPATFVLRLWRVRLVFPAIPNPAVDKRLRENFADVSFMPLQGRFDLTVDRSSSLQTSRIGPIPTRGFFSRNTPAI